MKDWSIEQANEAHRAYLAAGGDRNSPAGPLLQWNALQRIDFWRLAYEAGDTFAVLHAVADCAKHELVMPEWVKRGFLNRYRMVTRHKVKLLDEAFGTFLPKGAKLPAYRQEWEKGLLAYYEVERLHKEGQPIGTALFESVGKSLNIGSKARDYYYAYKESLTSKYFP